MIDFLKLSKEGFRNVVLGTATLIVEFPMELGAGINVEWSVYDWQ